MSKVLRRVVAEGIPVVTEYRCPQCGRYKNVGEIVWERRPTQGDPGKIGCCRNCRRAAQIFMHIVLERFPEIQVGA